MSCTPRQFSICVALALSLVGAPARAGDDASAAGCRRIMAAARSEASLLFGPRVTTQALRVPGSGDIDGSAAVPRSGYQVRAAVGASPLDMVRGAIVLDVARTRCEGAEARERLDQILVQGAAYGRGHALRAQIGRLETALPRVDAIVGKAEARLARQVATIAEVDDLRRRRLRLRRQLVTARHELALIDAQGTEPGSPGSVATLLGGYERATRDGERLSSRLRRLDAWRVDVRGGVIPDGDQTDWFGMVEVTYDIGGLWQRGHEQQYLRARRDELATARAEARDRAVRFARGMRDSAAALRDELRLLDDELAVIADELARLEALESRNASHARAVLELTGIELRAERAFVESLASAREEIGEVR